MNKNFLMWMVPVIILTIAACRKKDLLKPVLVKPAQGVYILNEGNFGYNNASLGYYDFATSAYTDLFHSTNGIKLGDVANDAIIYGGKMYIVVNNSGLLMVTNAATGKFIDSVQIKKPNKQGILVSMQPRNAVAYNGRVYVSTWMDGINVVDTSSLSVIQKIPLRNYGEGIAISGNKLCVAINGPWGEQDSVVSIINTASGLVEKNVVVGKNLGHVISDNSGNVFVNDAGSYDFATDKYLNGSLSKINIQTGQVVNKIAGAYGKSILRNNIIYALSGYNQEVKIKVIHSGDMTVKNENFITDGTVVSKPYGIGIDEVTDDIYIGDGTSYITSGKVYIFDKSGKLKTSFTPTGGIMPNTFLFKR